MKDKLLDAWALLWAIGYIYFAKPVTQWYKRHRRDADYFTHLSWIAGFMVSIMLFIWGISQ